MSPRRRSKAKRGWPPNLYERDGYFSWRHPKTREEFGIGRDRARAFAEAVEANIHLAGITKRPRLIDRLTGSCERSVKAWGEKYGEFLGKIKLADNTRRSYASLLRRTVAMYGERTMEGIKAIDVNDGLDEIASKTPRLAQALRNFQRDFFRQAIVAGWIDHNPVRDTKIRVPVVVKRARLEFDVCMQVYERATGWLKNAIALALVSAQRREDVSNAQFRDFREGYWWLEQASEKSEIRHRIQIPLDIKLNGFGLSLGDVVSQCRRTFVASSYLIHQTRPRGNSPVGSQIWVDTISRRFTDVLGGLGLTWGDNTPPTFHEIRSLSARLYKAQGINTTDLLGHNDVETTEIYHDTRGGWVKVTV